MKNAKLLMAYMMIVWEIVSCNGVNEPEHRKEIRKFYPSGQLEYYEVIHDDGEIPDSSIFYDWQGQVSSINITLKEGRVYHRSWWGSGGLRKEYYTVQGVEEGSVFEFHSNGILKTVMDYRRGIQFGESCSWDMAGHQTHYVFIGEHGEPCGNEFFYINGGQLDTIIVHPVQCQTEDKNRR
jgi:hypothetical protein